MEKKEITHDSVTYSEMCKPHENVEVFETNLRAFMEGVSALRKQHKIAEVLLTISDTVITEDGNTGTSLSYFGFGNSENQLGMAAYTYGSLQAEHAEKIAKLLKGKRK